jgi:hypothetical protein
MSFGGRTSIAAPVIVADELVFRIKAEFLEMPGLRLTRPQAQRLWALDDALCDAVLTRLLDTRFLMRSGDAAFVRAE